MIGVITINVIIIQKFVEKSEVFINFNLFEVLFLYSTVLLGKRYFSRLQCRREFFENSIRTEKLRFSCERHQKHRILYNKINKNNRLLSTRILIPITNKCTTNHQMFDQNNEKQQNLDERDEDESDNEDVKNNFTLFS